MWRRGEGTTRIRVEEGGAVLQCGGRWTSTMVVGDLTMVVVLLSPLLSSLLPHTNYAAVQHPTLPRRQRRHRYPYQLDHSSTAACPT